MYHPICNCKLFATSLEPVTIKRLQRWDEGRWGIGNKPQYCRVYTKDP